MCRLATEGSKAEAGIGAGAEATGIGAEAKNIGTESEGGHPLEVYHYLY